MSNLNGYSQNLEQHGIREYLHKRRLTKNALKVAIKISKFLKSNYPVNKEQLNHVK